MYKLKFLLQNFIGYILFNNITYCLCFVKHNDEEI